MKKLMADRTMLVICLCAALLLACFLILAQYLTPPELPEGGVFGMVLIDVADQETADSYHVDEYGIYVLAVQESSPAFAAGVASGDRLTGVNKLSLESTAHFEQIQKGWGPAEKILLDFQRGADAQPYQVTLVWNAE